MNSLHGERLGTGAVPNATPILALTMHSVLSLGCTRPLVGAAPSDSADSADSGNIIDTREDFPDAPEPGHEIRAPSFEVPPYSEVFWCYYGTYAGETVGVTWFEPLQTDEYSHHNLLRNVTDEGLPDGTMVECPSTDSMYDYAPLFEGAGVQPSADATNWLEMPDGVAMRLEQGQKWVLDMHYINPTGKTLIVQNGVNFGTIDPMEVEHWAAPVRMDGGIVELAPGEASTVNFDCTWPFDGHVLSIGGHMHEYGTHYLVEHQRADGSTSEVYDIEPRLEEYRDFPILANFGATELPVLTGESFRTSCNWFNTTETMLSFPDEMCTTFVVVYPLDSPLSCVEGTYTD